MYSGDKVIKSGSGCILYAEIINDKRGLDAVGCIGEKTWDIGFLELTVGEWAPLRAMLGSKRARPLETQCGIEVISVLVA